MVNKRKHIGRQPRKSVWNCLYVGTGGIRHDSILRFNQRGCEKCQSPRAQRKVRRAIERTGWNRRVVVAESERKEIKKRMKNPWDDPVYRRHQSEVHKGKKLSEEQKKKISLAHKGKIPKNFYEMQKKGWATSKKEQFNSNWKGQGVGYIGLHRWVQKHLGKPTKCEMCGKDGLSGRFIQWANKNHKYRRNLADWIRLCTPCHRKYDGLYGEKWSKKIKKG